MLISWHLLRKMLTLSHEPTARELADTLTMNTVEVDDYTDQARNLEHVVVGEVVDIRLHPNADKLKLARVKVGVAETEVVCGGVNLAKGMKVALASPGARVRWHGQGEWTTLVPAEIRGIKSEGMICAAEELDLPDDQAIEHGIMDLSYLEAEPGTPLARALGYDDIILDIDNKSLTNRPDLWGHAGLARELAAIWQVKFELPLALDIKPGKSIKLKVNIKSPEQVFRYIGVAVSNITVGESPLWLRRSLESLGVKPINNIVDVTNYVMLELGQPMHAFDYDKLASADIIVRAAKPNETITTLDEVVRELNTTDLVIADKKQAIAIAGIMGGAKTGITLDTTTIILESANFESIGIRKTATRLGLRTEASARFEKSLDPSLAKLALERAVTLLMEIMPGVQIASKVVDDYSTPLKLPLIKLDLDWLNTKLGVNLESSEVKNILERLGFLVESQTKAFIVTPPTWRATRDITIPEDLVEEVARLYGYVKIPLALPKFDIIPPERDEAKGWRCKIREFLTNLQWIETYSYSFVGKDDKLVQIKDRIELVNPSDKSKPYLRQFLLSNLVGQVAHNFKKFPGRDIKMYEIGRVFINKPGEYSGDSTGISKLPQQPYHLALVQKISTDSVVIEFMKLRGVVEAIMGLIGIDKSRIGFKTDDHGLFEILLDNNQIGILKDDIIESFPVIYAELNLDACPVGLEVVEYYPETLFPSITRDISLTLPSGTKWQAIESLVRTASPLVKVVELFDVYPTKNSMAFRIVFRSTERTLESAEVDIIMRQIIKELQQKFGAEIRE